jgi:hypothetical protein
MFQTAVSTLQDDHRNVFCVYRLGLDNINCITNDAFKKITFILLSKSLYFETIQKFKTI